MTFIKQFGQRSATWTKSRRGSACWGLTALFAVSFGSLAGDPFRFAVDFIITLAVMAGVVWLVARIWEHQTWPGTPPFARPRQDSSQRNQLRNDGNARLFKDRGGFLFERRYFFVATGLPPVRLSTEFVSGIQPRAELGPLPVATNGVRTWWQFEKGFWWENAGYQADDVLALLRERERRQKRGLERAHTLLKAEASPRNVRGSISREMQRAVFERDGGACVECNGTFSIQYDHIIPVAMGGATTVQNLQILCSYCNQAKGASI